MKLSKQRARLDVRKFFLSQHVVKDRNLLLQELVDATTVNQFKNRLDKFWKDMGIKSLAKQAHHWTRTSTSK